MSADDERKLTEIEFCRKNLKEFQLTFLRGVG